MSLRNLPTRSQPGRLARKFCVRFSRILVGVLSMRLADHHVLVTGATGGLGGSIARELAARGCALTVTGRDEAELTRLVAELGPRARAIGADLTNTIELHHLVDRLDDVDVLVASAGIGPAEDLADISE